MMCSIHTYFFLFFFFNATATTEIYTLSLHDALPISCSFALMTLLKDDQNFTTIDLNTHFFRPVTGGTLKCVGEVVNVSKTQAYVEATFFNDEGKVALKARAVERLLKA